MSLKRITAPSVTCVTLAEAKLHLRVTAADEDTLITALIEAGTEDAEHLMLRAVMPQTWQLTLDSWRDEARNASPSNNTGSALIYSSVQQWRPSQDASGDCITLSRPIVSAVNTVKYIDAATGTQLTLANTEYKVDLGSDLLARLAPAYGKTWPDTRAQIGAIEVVFTCGWADAAAVPRVIKQWILLRVGALYENREAWTLHRAIEPNPFIDHLLDRYRVFTL